MATKEFIMEQYNGTDYDILHPQTDAGQVLFGNSTVQQMLTNGVVRTDAQTLTTTEKAQARTNIDASAVSVSASGSATDTISYITVDGVEKKISGEGLFQHCIVCGGKNSINSTVGFATAIYTTDATPFNLTTFSTYVSTRASSSTRFAVPAQGYVPPGGTTSYSWLNYSLGLSYGTGLQVSTPNGNMAVSSWTNVQFVDTVFAL